MQNFYCCFLSNISWTQHLLKISAMVSRAPLKFKQIYMTFQNMLNLIACDYSCHQNKYKETTF